MGQAEFTGDHTIKVTGGKHGDRTLQFKKAMVGTGASPMVPPIPGLKDTPHLTNASKKKYPRPRECPRAGSRSESP